MYRLLMKKLETATSVDTCSGYINQQPYQLYLWYSMVAIMMFRGKFDEYILLLEIQPKLTGFNVF